MRIILHAAVAMNPQCGMSGDNRSGIHLSVHEPLDFGRLHRQKGDALCKGRYQFWGLYLEHSNRQVTCKRCQAIRERLEREHEVVVS